MAVVKQHSPEYYGRALKQVLGFIFKHLDQPGEVEYNSPLYWVDQGKSFTSGETVQYGGNTSDTVLYFNPETELLGVYQYSIDKLVLYPAAGGKGRVIPNVYTHQGDKPVYGSDRVSPWLS